MFGLAVTTVVLPWQNLGKCFCALPVPKKRIAKHGYFCISFSQANGVTPCDLEYFSNRSCLAGSGWLFYLKWNQNQILSNRFNWLEMWLYECCNHLLEVIRETVFKSLGATTVAVAFLWCLYLVKISGVNAFYSLNLEWQRHFVDCISSSDPT